MSVHLPSREFFRISLSLGSFFQNSIACVSKMVKVVFPAAETTRDVLWAFFMLGFSLWNFHKWSDQTMKNESLHQSPEHYLEMAALKFSIRQALSFLRQEACVKLWFFFTVLLTRKMHLLVTSFFLIHGFKKNLSVSENYHTQQTHINCMMSYLTLKLFVCSLLLPIQ